MKKNLLLLTLLIPPSLYAQTDYYRVDPVTGYKTKIGYSETRPTYTPPTFSPYVSKYDVDAYGNAIIQKQRQYDQNVESIQNVITETDRAIAFLVDNRIKDGYELRQNFYKYMEKLNKTKIDYSNYRTYSKVFNQIKKFYLKARNISVPVKSDFVSTPPGP